MVKDTDTVVHTHSYSPMQLRLTRPYKGVLTNLSTTFLMAKLKKISSFPEVIGSCFDKFISIDQMKVSFTN